MLVKPVHESNWRSDYTLRFFDHFRGSSSTKTCSMSSGSLWASTAAFAPALGSAWAVGAGGIVAFSSDMYNRGVYESFGGDSLGESVLYSYSLAVLHLEVSHRTSFIARTDRRLRRQEELGDCAAARPEFRNKFHSSHDARLQIPLRAFRTASTRPSCIHVHANE